MMKMKDKKISGVVTDVRGDEEASMMSEEDYDLKCKSVMGEIQEMNSGLEPWTVSEECLKFHKKEMEEHRMVDEKNVF